MDISVNKSTKNKARFKLELNIYDTLQIASNSTSILLWNKYQLFLYKNCDFYSTPVIFEPCFKINKVIIDEHYIICLDFDGHIHRISLTIKSSVLQINIPFEPVFQNIVSLLQLDESIICLKKYCGEYTLCLHERLNFNITKKIHLKNLPSDKNDEDIILKGYKITDLNKECASSFFKNSLSRGYMIFIVFDKIVYCKIIESDCEIPALMIYNTPTEIRDLEIWDSNNIDLLIGLKSGTILKLQFKDIKLKTLYLNVPIQKFIVINNSIFYSDGNTMWKNENLKPLTFHELYVKQPSDFIKFQNQIICVTYSKTIHKFLYEDKSVFIPSEFDETQPIEKYMVGINLIYDEIKKNAKVLESIDKEKLHITAIALSNQLQIVNESIELNVRTYDSYKDAITQKNITLTNDLNEYFIPNSTLISINLTFNDKNKEIRNLYRIIEKLKLHITITDGTQTKSLIFGPVTFEETFLIPFSNKTIDLKINVKLVTPILNNNEPIWTILYYKNAYITAEHFINVKKELDSGVNCLRKNENIKDLILDICEKLHGDLFKFSVNENVKTTLRSYEFNYYIKLPVNFEKLLCNTNKYRKLSKSKQECLFKKLNNNDFFKHNHLVQIHLQNDRVILQIINDNCDIFMKITSANPKTGYQFRKFFYEVLFDENEQLEWIPQAQYTALEDLRRKLTSLQCQRNLDEKLLLNIADKFNKNHISRLPM